MRALDLFCGAGGATKGLQRAGFHVTGVDIKPQPRYCGDEFIRADVMALAAAFEAPGPGETERVILSEFDFVWASPPCQKFTALQNVNKNADAHEDHIDYIRNWLTLDAEAFVIENVVGAPLENPVMLCGSMFGLGAQGCRTERHRLFETTAGGRGTQDVWRGGHKAAASEALGIDWMTLTELSEAIPPAYSEFIARAFLAQRKQVAA